MWYIILLDRLHHSLVNCALDCLVLHPQCPNNVIHSHRRCRFHAIDLPESLQGLPFLIAFAAAAVISPLPAGCRVDASAPHPLDSASASKCATSAYQGPIASCLLAPLLSFASRTPAGCHIACCCVPPPRVTFRRTGTARVHPRPLLFVRASWLLRRISSHRLRLLTGRRLMTGCVVAVTDAQA